MATHFEQSHLFDGVDPQLRAGAPALVGLRFFWNTYAANALGRADRMVPR